MKTSGAARPAHPRTRRTAHALVGAVALGVALSPVLVAGASNGSTVAPQYRATSAPNVFYPVHGTRLVKDLKTFTGTRHNGTDIKAPCHVPVYATHPGILHIATNVAWSGKYYVTVAAGGGSGLTTSYGYMGKVTAVEGQVIQSGQQIGTVGMQGRAQGCELFFKVRNNGRLANPSGWLGYYVGKPAPVGQMFGVSGINVASFNNLGASHTRIGSGSRYPAYPSRTVAGYDMLQRMHVDVVGMQEFQEPQSDLFLKTANGAFASFYWTGGTVEKPKRDTENSIVWRTASMELVSAATYDIPYFNGNTRHMPYVLLRQRSSGREAYFINTHNPASNVFGYGDQSKYRAQAIAIQRALVINLRATGLPVFLTGDLNDRQPAFCPLTAGKLMISANSIPSMTCAYPSQSSIDWVLVAGQARFSTFDYDKYPKDHLISDHPIVLTRVFLAAQPAPVTPPTTPPTT